MTSSNTTTLTTTTEGRLSTLWPTLLALLFGAFLVYMTGFAQPQAVHSAAHDTRHSFAVPCH